MNIDKVQALMALLKDTDIQELRLVDEDGTIELKRGAGHAMVFSSKEEANQVKSEPTPIPVSQSTQVRAPLVGTYYSRKSPDTEPFLHIGQKIKSNDTLCILEAMKVMNEIKSPVNGTVVKINGIEGTLVSYDQVLCEIEEDHV
jgi:acetyl-CoA carboxylase biotin carboxyl carrier protein